MDVLGLWPETPGSVRRVPHIASQCNNCPLNTRLPAYGFPQHPPAHSFISRCPAAASRLALDIHMLGVWRPCHHFFCRRHPPSFGFVAPVLSSFYVETWGFPGGSDSKESAHNAGNLGSVFGLVRCPGEGNGNPLQHSCLENSTDGTWLATVHGVAKSQV